MTGLLLKRPVVMYAFLLAAACLAVLFPLLSAGYLHIDDPQHFFHNPLILDPSPNPLQAFFFTPDSVNRTYVPLTLWSFYVELFFFKVNPFASHAINLLLHYMTVLMVMALGRRLGLSLKAAFAAAFLFAVHPMHVESVAWITERKDVLYSFFYLAALVFYCDYLESREGRKYIAALLAAALSVFAKPMALSLPLVLFIIDIFKGRKVSLGMFLDKAPFFLVVEPIALVTYSMNARGLSSMDASSPFIIIWCLVFYIQKFIVPTDISFFFYKAPWPVWEYQQQYAQAAAVFGLIIVVLFLLRKNRWVLFAFFFYALSTFFLWRPDAEHDSHFVADRFMYLPSAGFCFLAGYLLEKALDRWPLRRRPLIVITVALAGILAVVSFTKAKVWHSTFSMYMEVHQRKNNSFELARAMTACLLSDWCVDASCSDIRKVYFSDKARFGPYDLPCDGKIKIAAQILSMKQFRRILASYPGNIVSIVEVGGIYWQWKAYDKAIAYFSRSVARLPYEAGGYYMLGLCYEGKKDLNEAMILLDKAARLDPSMSEVYMARSRVAASLGDKKKAIDDALRYIEMQPLNEASYDHAIDVLTRIKEESFVRAVQEMKRKTFSLAVMK